ncbi:MAG TPA: hypothetical protein VL284_04175 [Thermoanaerobaculia bacterium]|nr:hypothetical protein [Thermoanaerobaculia bacterium]
MRFRFAALLLVASSVFAADEFTVYDLLPPATHSFAIVYDVTQEKEGAEFFLNPIRPGSVSTKEKVIDRATGAELKFEEVTNDKGNHFIKVHFPAPVPKNGQMRMQITKTYTDPKSYFVKDGLLIFDRPMGIKRDVVILPKGWELIGSASPAITSTDPDGRARVSFLNDRDDELPVKITARPSTAAGGTAVAPSFHRAVQDREISYWLLDPSSHQFLISHDFTVTRAGQASVHSFVRAGSVVAPDSKMIDLDTGEPLPTHLTTGKAVNSLGYYGEKVPDDMAVVQGDLPHPVEQGKSTRVRVIETYTDPVSYTIDGNELVWKRTLGRPLNFVTLPAGWMLTSVNTPAVIALDDQGRVKMRFTNTRDGDLDITIRARKR